LLNACGFHHVRAVSDIRMRHVTTLLVAIASKSARTQCNYLAHLRGVLRAAGNPQVLALLAVGNRALGIPAGSRLGTKRAMRDAEFSQLLKSIDDPRLRAILLLERAFGLRALEALRAGPSLHGWLACLVSGADSIEVVWGTKGGRPRKTRIHDRDRAIASLGCAIDVMGTGQRLVTGATLKAALAWYRNKLYRLGVQGHRLRYAFACAAVDKYLSSGMSEAEAFARVAMDLGHGDGRGRWVKMVYAREMLAKKAS